MSTRRKPPCGPDQGSRGNLVHPDHHVPAQQLGGAAAAPALEQRSPRAGRRQGARRAALLRLAPGQTAWAPLPGLPAGGRDECRGGERPCRYVACRDNLLRIDGADRPGHRWDGRPPQTIIRTPEPGEATCGRDHYEREHTAAEIGRLIGGARPLGKRRVQQIVRGALDKLRAHGAGLDALVGT